MTIAQEIAEYLEDCGVGTVGTDMFAGYLPDNANSAIGVFDTGGMKPDTYIPTKEPTFQVLIRSSSYSAGWTKLASVRSYLHQKENATLIDGGTYFYFIFAMAEGGALGKNARGLHEFSINFQARTR